jgi:hypothetical protein
MQGHSTVRVSIHANAALTSYIQLTKHWSDIHRFPCREVVRGLVSKMTRNSSHPTLSYIFDLLSSMPTGTFSNIAIWLMLFPSHRGEVFFRRLMILSGSRFDTIHCRYHPSSAINTVIEARGESSRWPRQYQRERCAG